MQHHCHETLVCTVVPPLPALEYCAASTAAALLSPVPLPLFDCDSASPRPSIVDATADPLLTQTRCDLCHSVTAGAEETLVLRDVDFYSNGNAAAASSSPHGSRWINVCNACEPRHSQCSACHQPLRDYDLVADFCRRAAVRDRGLFHARCTCVCDACQSRYPAYRMHIVPHPLVCERNLYYCPSCDPSCPTCGRRIRLVDCVRDVIDSATGEHWVYHVECLGRTRDPLVGSTLLARSTRRTGAAVDESRV